MASVTISLSRPVTGQHVIDATFEVATMRRWVCNRDREDYGLCYFGASLDHHRGWIRVDAAENQMGVRQHSEYDQLVVEDVAWPTAIDYDSGAVIDDVRCFAAELERHLNEIA
ncbi:hypothetical protein [Actinoallomurus sp. NPDC052274]|uniref:hypothetical protein n=1 Tax=Actinoallomurus sp. NPDC052274 TaxID=3155420 RepID=UPI00341A2F81